MKSSFPFLKGGDVKKIALSMGLLLYFLSPSLFSGQADGVLLSPEKGLQLLHQCSRQSINDATGSWSPMQGDLLKLEVSLVRFLNEKKIPQYLTDHRQYGGFLRGKKKFIYINAFKNADANWKTEPVLVCDGGPAFWGAEYDVANDKIVFLDFNGPYQRGDPMMIKN
jgi:hypothetical protein